MTRLARVWGKPALLLAGLAIAALSLHGLGLDARGAVQAAGQHGPAGFIVLGTLACAVGVPRQAVALAGGYVFGFWAGTALALVAELGGCAANFWWVRLLGREAARRFLSRREGGRLHRLDRAMAERTFATTLTIRLLPVGSNLVTNLLAGLSGIAVVPFLAASLLGYVPQTVVFALAGAGAEVSSTVQLALSVALFVCSTALGLMLLRRRPVPA